MADDFQQLEFHKLQVPDNKTKVNLSYICWKDFHSYDLLLLLYVNYNET